MQTVNWNGGKTFTITPNAHYHVADVLVDGSSVGAVTSYTFSNVTANHTISATFAIDTYTITPSAGANGTISPAGVQTVNWNGSQAFTITPSAHYHVADVLVDGIVGRCRDALHVQQRRREPHDQRDLRDRHVHDHAERRRQRLDLAGRRRRPSTTGASKTFTITPTTHYHVADVLVDGSSVGAVGSYTFTNVTANHTISATFAIDTYTITPCAGANGAISPATVQTVNYGGSRTFTITPDTGYHVADVLVNGASVGAVTSYDFTNVTANHTISATFAINTYTITPSAGANGSISPSRYTDGGLWRQQELHDHAGRGLPRRRRARGRLLGRRRDVLHLHQRHCQRNDFGDVCHEHLHDHTEC